MLTSNLSRGDYLSSTTSFSQTLKDGPSFLNYTPSATTRTSRYNHSENSFSSDQIFRITRKLKEVERNNFNISRENNHLKQAIEELNRKLRSLVDFLAQFFGEDSSFLNDSLSESFDAKRISLEKPSITLEEINKILKNVGKFQTSNNSILSEKNSNSKLSKINQTSSLQTQTISSNKTLEISFHPESFDESLSDGSTTSSDSTNSSSISTSQSPPRTSSHSRMHKTHKSRTHFRTPKRDSSNRSTAKSSQRRHSVGVTPLNLSSARRPSSPSTLSARRSFGDTQQNSQRNKSFLQSDGPKERSIRFSETFNGSSRNIQQAQNYASSPSSSSSISLSDHLLVSSHRSPQAKESPFTRASPVIHSPHTFLMPQMNSPKQDATIQRKVSIRSPSLAAAALQKDPVQSSSQSGTAFPSPSSFASSPHFPSPSTKSASESSLFAFSTSNSFLPQNEGAKSTPFTSFTSTPTAPSASFQSNRTQMPSSTVSFANTASTPSVNMQPSTPSISLVSSQFAARINEFSTFAKNYMQLQKPTNQTAKHSLSPLETPAPKQQIFNQSASLSSYPFSSSKPFNESNEAKSDNIITDLTENDGLAAQSFEMKTCKEKFEEKDEVELGD